MILSGTILAARIEDETRAFIKKHALTPKLVVILVGNDAASQTYVARKIAAAKRVGIRVELLRLENASTDSLVELIKSLNTQPDTNAILIQLPLPANITANAVMLEIDPAKDVDGFHPKNIAAYTNGKGRAPVLISAIDSLLIETGQNLQNKIAVIVGKSDVFTAPLSYALEQHGLSVSWIKPDDANLNAATRAADLIITAVGQPGIIRGENIKKGATLIDVGITRLPNGKVAGDVDIETTAPRAEFLTPTPGGVGPVTVAMVMRAVVLLAREHANVM